MSLGVTCRFNSGNKMFWSVKQCMKSTLIKSKKTIFLRRFNAPAILPKTFTLVNISHRTIKEGSRLSMEFWRSDIILKSRPIACFNGGSYSTKSAGDECAKQENDNDKLTLYQKFKKMYKEYWYVLIPVHLLTSSIWFSGFYYLAASGIDIPALLQSFGAPDSWVDSLQNSKSGNIVLAYTLYKVATPLRYTVTLGGTTISINYLKKWGWIKPITSKKQFMKMRQQKKDALKDLKTVCGDKMQVAKDELLKVKKELSEHYMDAKEEFSKSVKETRTKIKENIKSSNDWKLFVGWLIKGIKGDQNSIDKKK